jgi:hypothetical protein
VDGEQIQIYGFDSLENDGTYTYGPAPVAQQQQKRSPRKRAPAKLTNQKKKVGVKKGSKRDDKPQAFWYLLSQKHENSKTKWKSQRAFLRSEESGTEVGEDQKMSFSRALTKYRDGKLKKVNESRVHTRSRQYEAVDKRAVDDVDRAAHTIPVHRNSNKRTTYASPSILSFFGSSSSTGST